jgi:hypothetical protein
VHLKAPSELDAGIGSRELPHDLCVGLVAPIFPGGDFLDQCVLVWNTLIELNAKSGSVFGVILSG